MMKQIVKESPDNESPEQVWLDNSLIFLWVVEYKNSKKLRFSFREVMV